MLWIGAPVAAVLGAIVLPLLVLQSRPDPTPALPTTIVQRQDDTAAPIGEVPPQTVSPSRPTAGASITAASGSSDATSPRAATVTAEERYLRAIEMIEREVSSTRNALPGPMAESLTYGLGELDKTIAAAQRVWRSAPDDPLATRYLLSAYARKLELLMRHATVS